LSDNRNMLLAIVLSVIVLLGWSILSERFFPTASEPSTKFENGKQVALPKPQADPTADAPAAIRDRRQVLAETKRVAIDTPSLKGSINLQGARIDDLVLVRHRQNLSKDSPPIRLLSPAGAPEAYFANFGWTGEGVALPGPGTVWTASGKRLTPSSPITLSWNNGQGQNFEIRLGVDDGYMFTAEQIVTNTGTGAVAVRPFTLISRATASKDPDPWTAHVGAVGVFNGAANYDWGYAELAEQGDQRFNSRGGWLGFSDTYWLTAVIPDQRSSVEAGFLRSPTGGFQAVATPAPSIVQPGKAIRLQSHVFAGAKEVRMLDSYSDALGTELERAIDWGWFRWFMKPIFSLLNWLFAMIGNFGVAIICLTIIVRALMFPIAQRQFRSMAKMRVVQPKMKAVQDRYKDDKPRMQQEMLKLYQEEKVIRSPAACRSCSRSRSSTRSTRC
jgi:YidC/Oxa1 family membrane protein insertase